MSLIPSFILPKNILSAIKRGNEAIQVSARLTQAAAEASAESLSMMQTKVEGLSEAEAQRRLEEVGPNVVTHESRFPKTRLFIKACLNPLVILLSILVVITFWTAGEPSDYVGGAIMIAMVVLGVALRFVQEARADAAAAKLKAMIRVTATVVRGGKTREISLSELVPGDVVRLAAGDMIPADLRILFCKDLFLIQSSLTGESFPVEKFDMTENLDGKMPLELRNICFLGTSVESGSATAVIVETASELIWAEWRARSRRGRLPRALTKASPASRG